MLDLLIDFAIRSCTLFQLKKLKKRLSEWYRITPNLYEYDYEPSCVFTDEERLIKEQERGSALPVETASMQVTVLK